MLDESFKTCDEIPIVDARAIVEQVARVPAAISNIEVNGFEAAWVTRFAAVFEGAVEETVAHTSCVGKGFKLRTNAGDVVADVVGGVEPTPFLERSRSSVKTFKRDVEVDDGRWEISEDMTHGLVRFWFRFRVTALPFTEVGESKGQEVKVQVRTYNVPGTFEN